MEKIFRTVLCAILLVGGVGAQNYDNRTDPGVLAVQRALPSVVSINTESTVEVVRDPRHAQILKEFEGTFPKLPGMFEQRKVGGFGTGVIIDKSGYIVTNLHNVRQLKNTRIEVILANGEKYAAQFVVGDERNDLALLKIEPKNPLPVIELSGEELLLAQPVLALGNPFGLENTVTRGILSSKNRNVNSNGRIYDELLQTDAAINPGNSGGALIDLNGKLIGINVLVLQKSQGIGFAIPILKVLDVLSIFLSLEQQKGLSFGARFIDRNGRVTVQQVLPQTLAAEKLQPGDVIVLADGRKFDSMTELQTYLIQTKKEGDTVTLEYQRGASPMSTALTVGRLKLPPGLEQAQKKLGLSLLEPTSLQADSLGYSNVRGLLVTEVENGSQAQRAGLLKGMLISSVRGKPVQNDTSLSAALTPLKSGETVTLGVIISQRIRNTNQFVQYTGTVNLPVR